MSNVKIKRTFVRYSKLFGKKLMYDEIAVPKETIVRHVPIRTVNRYEVPKDQINDSDCYEPLLRDPSYNTKQINKAYCKRTGLLDYTAIQKILAQYHDLSIRQFAHVLGVSPATLCNAKNGEILPSKLMSNTLQLLADKKNMTYLIRVQKRHRVMNASK